MAADVELQKEPIKRRLEEAQIGGDVSMVRLDAGKVLRIKCYG